MPERPLSRNSTSVACVPTATMSSAPLSSASSIATSSLVPVAGKTTGSTPSSADPLQARARCRRGRRARRSRRRSAAPRRRPSPCRRRSGPGGSPPRAARPRRRRRRSGPAGTRGCSGERREVLLVVVPAHHDERRAGRRGSVGCRARRRRRAAGRAPAGGTPSCWPRTPRAGRPGRRAPRPWTSRRLVVQGLAGGDDRSPTQTVALVDPHLLALVHGVLSASRPTSSISGMPASTRISGPRLG